MDEVRPTQARLASVALDPASMGHRSAGQAQERQAAIRDLLDANSFAVPGHRGGPYRLTLAMRETRVVFDIRTEADEPVATYVLSLQPLRGLMRDYLMVCSSHAAAVRTATPSQIESIDMGRRGLHDEAAERLADRLRGKVEADFVTMRRLFTLLMTLHWAG